MIIYALLAGLFSGIIGAMGMGGGAVLVVYLTVFLNTEQLKAGGINLLFFIPIALLSVIIYAVKKQIEWKTVLIMAPFGVLGTFLGVFLTDIISVGLISKLFGGFLIILGIKEIFTKNKNLKKR